MDWSKAKNILIIALLITNLVLGFFYLQGFSENKKNADSFTESLSEYIEQRGGSVECGLPVYGKKLPVLFVSFSKDAAETSYKGIPVESESESAVVESAGDAKAKIRPSAEAVLDMISDGSIQTEGLVISDVKLVYWTEHSAYVGGGQDTAFPSWRIETNSGVYHVTAYY